jgi:hypothetical protein
MQMRRARAKAIVAGLTLATALAIGVAAAAATDDRATTEAVLREVSASPKKDIAAEMIARSRGALDRAAKLRASGDEAHARLADGLARTWAEAARDVVRASEVEERAHAARRAATDAGVIAERERALLEEGIAQSGRVRAQLDAVERESKEQPARTSAAANADTDGGAPRPKAPAARDGGAR